MNSNRTRVVLACVSFLLPLGLMLISSITKGADLLKIFDKNEAGFRANMTESYNMEISKSASGSSAPEAIANAPIGESRYGGFIKDNQLAEITYLQNGEDEKSLIDDAGGLNNTLDDDLYGVVPSNINEEEGFLLGIEEENRSKTKSDIEGDIQLDLNEYAYIFFSLIQPNENRVNTMLMELMFTDNYKNAISFQTSLCPRPVKVLGDESEYVESGTKTVYYKADAIISPARCGKIVVLKVPISRGYNIDFLAKHYFTNNPITRYLLGGEQSQSANFYFKGNMVKLKRTILQKEQLYYLGRIEVKYYFEDDHSTDKNFFSNGLVDADRITKRLVAISSGYGYADLIKLKRMHPKLTGKSIIDLSEQIVHEFKLVSKETVKDLGFNGF